MTLFEGEMIDAVLVNRIIADTEPSPVVCQISKDVFDNTGRYVVLPANSRIVGVSQVVNYKGAHRLFISFHRIILPNGPSIDFPPSKKAMKALDRPGPWASSPKSNVIGFSSSARLSSLACLMALLVLLNAARISTRLARSFWDALQRTSSAFWTTSWLSTPRLCRPFAWTKARS